jgi:hypothetical protein
MHGPVSPLRVQELIRRYRRRTAALAVVVALGGAVAFAHSGVQDAHMDTALAWCAAVLPVASVVALVAVATVPLARVSGLTTCDRAPAARRLPPPRPKARDGPTRLTVLRL